MGEGSTGPKAGKSKLPAYYNLFAVLLALPTIAVFLQMILRGVGGSSALSNAGLLVGATWLLVPLGSLTLVVVSTFPSVGERARGTLSVLALLLVFFLAALPLFLILWV